MISIRKATCDDILSILEIAKIAVTEDWTYNYIKERITREDTSLLIAALTDLSDGNNGKELAVGFAAVRQVGESGELLQIAVDPKYRRSGAGSRLIKAVLEDATGKALKSVLLEVRAGNTPAINLYEKHGFHHMRIRKDYYNNPTEDAVVMVREI